MYVSLSLTSLPPQAACFAQFAASAFRYGNTDYYLLTWRLAAWLIQRVRHYEREARAGRFAQARYDALRARLDALLADLPSDDRCRATAAARGQPFAAPTPPRWPSSRFDDGQYQTEWVPFAVGKSPYDVGPDPAMADWWKYPILRRIHHIDHEEVLCEFVLARLAAGETLPPLVLECHALRMERMAATYVDNPHRVLLDSPPSHPKRLIYLRRALYGEELPRGQEKTRGRAK